MSHTEITHYLDICDQFCLDTATAAIMLGRHGIFGVINYDESVNVDTRTVLYVAAI